MPTLRQRIEEASLPTVSVLNGLPGSVTFLAILALMIAGVFVPGWGWLLLVLVLAFLIWTLYLSWPALEPTPRLMRVSLVLLVVAITITQAVPRS